MTPRAPHPDAARRVDRPLGVSRAVLLLGPHRIPVKTVADLQVVQDLFLRTRHEPTPAAFPAAVAALGDSGVPISAVPRSPLPALLADWCGVMQTIYLMTDEPAAVADTLTIIDRANDAAFECVTAGPAELLHFCDNLDSGNCASYFESHMAEYYRRRLGQLHAAGKVAAVHLDGAVRGLLPRLAACGFDGIESVTPAPVATWKSRTCAPWPETTARLSGAASPAPCSPSPGPLTTSAPTRGGCWTRSGPPAPGRRQRRPSAAGRGHRLLSRRGGDDRGVRRLRFGLSVNR